MIEICNKTGTCFTIDIDGKQYLITARHLVDDWVQSQPFHIFHDKQWREIKLSLVGKCKGKIDIAVLTSPFQLSPAYALPATAKNIIFGQDVYFLGFPYGWYGNNEAEILGKFPMPFVKKAILSCSCIEQDGGQQFYLDGHNNPGFSGGPVVYKQLGKNKYKVASVISGYRYTYEPVFAKEKELPLAYKYNTGIIISNDIKYAVELINENPIGVSIKT